MQAFVISDLEKTTYRVRDAMLRSGIDCPAQGMLVLDLSSDQLSHAHPDLIVLALSPNPDRALAVLAKVRPQTKGRVLVVGPTNDSRYVLQAMREGADDYVDETQIDAEFPAALGRLRTPTAASS